jgi:hypothetical protein
MTSAWARQLDRHYWVSHFVLLFQYFAEDLTDLRSGSPVGRWAGYFLMQHKTQLGGNRFISKVRVFKPDVGSLPYMLFYADGVAANNAREKAEEIYIIKRSNNGKNILREHIFRVEVRGVALRTMSERADVE